MIIYDLGANTGSDLAYYLSKSSKVIAVEANPMLCESIKQKFAKEVSQKRLVIENVAITESTYGDIDFFIHLESHERSTLLQPAPEDIKAWKKVVVQACPIKDLILKHGEPHYIKIDIEGMDTKILKSLSKHNIKPKYISAESHFLSVFATLSEEFGYNAFKLVDGFTVNQIYKDRTFTSPITNKQFTYSFPWHSAGPFGEDIDGSWQDKESFLKLIATSGLGWKDIHATTIENLETHNQRDHFLELNTHFFTVTKISSLPGYMALLAIRLASTLTRRVAHKIYRISGTNNR